MTKKSKCRIRTTVISGACFLFIFMLTCHEEAEQQQDSSEMVVTENLR